MTLPRRLSPPRTRFAICLITVTVLLIASVGRGAGPADNPPIKPIGADGKPLNLDFEDGTLKDWTATGDAFDGQPVRGDLVAKRRNDMKSAHQGDFWIGGFEVKGDDGTGTLTSAPFKVTHRWASFLVAGGPWPETRVELVRAGDHRVFFQATGYENETLRPVVIDLEKQMGREIFIRLVDERKGHWGHINFDEFAFYDQRPHFADELDPNKKTSELLADVYKHAGLPPEQAAAAMDLPPGFKAQLFAAEPDVVNPIAFTIDARGRLWVVEGLTYPVRAPEEQGRDRILVFEDERGEGHFTKRTVFAENLNLVSGIEVGFGGVYVGAAPYLMHIPADVNADEPKPTGKPEILLDGFGYQDTHETLNSFCWGPDGWLYGCHGVFTQSDVGKPGTPTAERVHLNAGVWRYHPVRKVFERFAEGTSNPWGVDFDEHGQCFIEACVIPHLWHMIQGAHYQRQGGQHDNPYLYADITTIADHLHWASAANPWAANGKSAAVGGGHAHAGLMCYLGGSWPAEYTGKLFMNNIHGARINMDVLEAKGSGFVGHHGKDFIVFNDQFSQIVNLRYDQDGNVYMIDWYDRNQCHSPNPAAHDRTTGRIFKIVYGETKSTKVDLEKSTDHELVQLQFSKNEWNVRTARRLLQEREWTCRLNWKDVPQELIAHLDGDADESEKLRALWALHAIREKLRPDVAGKLLQSDFPYLVGWTIQLVCEDQKPTTIWNHFVTVAKQSRSPVVRLYLASALQQMPLDHRWDILTGLLSHAEDADDHNLPLMDWYALEPLCVRDPQRALALAAGAKVPHVLSFAVRRIGASGGSATDALVAALNTIDDEPRRLEVLHGIRDSLRGRRSVPMPKGWTELEPKLMRAGGAVTAEARLLAVTFGNPDAIGAARLIAMDATSPPAERRAALDALVGIKDPALPEALRALLGDDLMRATALRALANYDDPATPKAILRVYPRLNPAERKDALATLAARLAYARELLASVGAGTIPARDVSADIVRQLRTLNDKSLDAQVAKVWGVLRDSPEDKKKRIAQLKGLVNAAGKTPDLSHGRLLFNKTCAQCHSLYDVGGHVGPDLTGSNRSDLDYLLENVVDPNAVIPADYRTTQIETTDGRTVMGVVKKEDEKSMTVAMPGQDLLVPKAEIQSRRLSNLSMMPEGLLDAFPDADTRDLIAYLRAKQQVPLPAETSAAPAQR